MRYCKHCILPDTRPNIAMDAEGMCSGCRYHATKPQIDWAEREAAFAAVAHKAKEASGGHDCLIPVSGGKDSHWQVIKCLEHGLNPLAVTWRTPGRTEIGELNLDNLVSLGVDHVDFRVNPKVERKFMYEALQRCGSTAVPMHMAIFAVPLNLAARLRIPLVVWGENSGFEYGSPDDALTGFQMDRPWLERFGVTHGTTAEDWISERLSRKELTPYFWPTDVELEQAKVKAVFLGWYFPWDPETTLNVAREHGFVVRGEGPKTGTYDYADIDDDFISIHHWLKWYKFGFTRSWDNLSLEIRNGRLSRANAIEQLRARGDETPHEDIAKLCSFMGIDSKRLFEIAEGFRNSQIWNRSDGNWKIDGFLIPDWDWGGAQ